MCKSRISQMKCMVRGDECKTERKRSTFLDLFREKQELLTLFAKKTREELREKKDVGDKGGRKGGGTEGNVRFKSHVII